MGSEDLREETRKKRRRKENGKKEDGGDGYKLNVQQRKGGPATSDCWGLRGDEEDRGE